MAMSSKWTQFADYSPVAESGASAHNFVFAPSPTMIYAPTANARAMCMDEAHGVVKILADEYSDRVLGVHILGPQASSLIAEAVMAMAMGASSEDIARTCHAHPSLPEAIREAALAVDGRMINS